MNVLVLVLLIASAVCFFLALIGVGGRINLTAAGLFCWVLVPLCQVINGWS